MKKILMIAAVAGIGLATFSGCKKSSSSSPTYSMSATVTPKTGSTSNFTASGSTYVIALDSLGIFEVVGVQVSGATPIAEIAFESPYYKGAGTYVINDTSSAAIEYYVYSTSAALSMVRGQLVITSVSGENVTGTFSGTMSDSSVIANGTFAASGKGF